MMAPARIDEMAMVMERAAFCPPRVDVTLVPRWRQVWGEVAPLCRDSHEASVCELACFYLGGGRDDL
jgi:hypothetical protein